MKNAVNPRWMWLYSLEKRLLMQSCLVANSGWQDASFFAGNRLRAEDSLQRVRAEP